jgi:hypothetical protein
MTVKIQKEFVPIATVQLPGGSVPVYVTKEWRRPLEELAKLVNEQQATIAALQARLTAGGL